MNFKELRKYMFNYYKNSYRRFDKHSYNNDYDKKIHLSDGKKVKRWISSDEDTLTIKVRIDNRKTGRYATTIIQFEDKTSNKITVWTKGNKSSKTNKLLLHSAKHDWKCNDLFISSLNDGIIDGKVQTSLLINGLTPIKLKKAL